LVSMVDYLCSAISLPSSQVSVRCSSAGSLESWRVSGNAHVVGSAAMR